MTMAEKRRVYCAHCEQTILTAEVETCPLCRKTGGLLDPMSPAALEDIVAKKRQESVPIGWVGDSGFAAYRFIRLLIGGVACGLIGLVFLFWELSQAQPSDWGLIRSVTISVLGFGLVGVLVWVSAKGRR